MTGTTLSHYRITAELGRGGMGIVYLAEDTKLDRKVAIKVLPASALASNDDRARFYREAKAAAALNHPNIAQIYQIDEAVPSDAPHGTQPSPFIAMEYIDGETLDARIKRGPLKLREAIRLATQIAGALGAAHEKGIVHRDVKASNVMLTSKGDSKVLDFGLALTAASTKLTRMGSTLGTVAYMSPEQARGEEVDRRTDLWALGVVLYEMVAGRNPFGGDYEQAVVYSILNAEPEPLTAVRTGVPMELERIVNKALNKQADFRYQTAADLLADLKALDVASASLTAGSTLHGSSHTSGSTLIPAAGSGLQVSKRQIGYGFGLTALFAALITLGVVSMTSEASRDTETVREYAINLPGVLFMEDPHISPDGTRIAFQGRDSTGRVGVFEWELIPGGQLHYLEGSEEGSQPAYSPDGRFLTYNPRGRPHPIRYHAVGGGPAQSIPGTETMWMAMWEDNETMLATDEPGNLLRIKLDGTKETVAVPDSSKGQTAIVFNQLDPTGRYGATFVEQRDSSPHMVGIVDLAKNEHWVLVEGGAMWPYFVDDNTLLYSFTGAGRNNWHGVQTVQRISDDRKELIGSPVALKYFGESPGYAYTMAEDGSLWRSANFSWTSRSFLLRHELVSGARHDVLMEYARVGGINLSPNGEDLAFNRYGEFLSYENQAIEVIHLDDNRVEMLFEGDSIAVRAPLWSPDGASLFFSQVRDGTTSIFRLPTDFSSPPEKVLDNAVHLGLSSDGSMMIFARPAEPDEEVELLDMTGLFIYSFDTGSVETHDAAIDASSAAFSPDNRYLAYESDGQVWVDMVLAPNPRRIAQGLEPVWDPSGAYLYYTGQPLRSLQRVPISLQPTFALQSDPESLFDQWFSGAFRIDFVRGYAYSEAQLDVDLDDDATVIKMENFPAFVRRVMEGQQ